MAGLSTVTAATVDPVSTQELRDFARLDDAIDSNFINSFIKASTMFCEEYTNKSFINRTLKMSLDGVAEVDIPLREGVTVGPIEIFYNRHIELPKSPVSSVTHIKYYNDSDTESTWATSNYYVDTQSDPAKILLRDGGTWPTNLRKANGIEITYVSGYGSNRSDTPEAIRVAIMQMALFMYEHRGEDEKQGFGSGIKAPYSVASLLSPYVTRRYGVSPFEGTYRSLA